MEAVQLRRIPLNLQWFAGEKTEKPTPKRVQDARKKGQVAKSQEVNTAVILLLGFLVLYIFAGSMYQEFAQAFRHFLTFPHGTELSVANFLVYLEDAFYIGLRTGAPVLGTLMVAGLIANYAQVGFLFTTETIKVDFKKLDPIQGFKNRIFSMRSLVELVKSIAKITLIGYVVYRILQDNAKLFPSLMAMDINQSMAAIADLMFSIGWQVALVFIVLALMDYAYQRYEHTKSLRMSKQDIRDEYKTMEGDPEIRGKRRSLHRQMSMNRMMAEVPKADVVITNPTHFAIALSYKANEMSAPLVLAKGKDYLALKIKEVARENGIVMVENKPLAQALYKQVEIGGAIPADLFQAVAEVLAFVYRLKKRVR